MYSFHRVIKTYFLLQQSDFLTQFFDVAHQDLVKPSNQVSKEKLQALLDLILRSSVGDGHSESVKDSIRVNLESISLFEKLLKINAVSGVDVKRYMSEVWAGNAHTEHHVSVNPRSGGLVGDATMALTGKLLF